MELLGFEFGNGRLLRYLADTASESGLVGNTVGALKASLGPYRLLMNDYSCAMLQVEARFRAMNSRMALQGEKNPIESISTRIKDPESIFRKLEKLKVPPTLESIEENLSDVAGVRVICSFIDDIYRIEKYFTSQDDITVTWRKDYIERPKPSGYRSLHLVVKTPIYNEKGRKEMAVEVQLRTIAMDFWASLEHKLRYKKNLDPALLESLSKELEDCAEMIHDLDTRMLSVRERIQNGSDPQKSL